MKKRMLRIKILKALTDETRLQILEMLKHGEKFCVCEFQKRINKSQSTISSHLKTLMDADLLVSWKEGTKT
ncbi:MAG: ArsR/SmtB family transcription factor [Candidatus Helarchaeota archaeon]